MINQGVILTDRRPTFTEIDINKIEPSPHQPRKYFNEEALVGLAKTFRHIGILEPLCVRKSDIKPGYYELVAGERRLRAAKLAGMQSVPCLVSYYSEEEAAQAALIENTAREDLDSISKAKAMQNLITKYGYTHEVLADILGMNRVTVTQQLRLLKLDARLQRWLQEGDMTEGHGKVLAGLKHEEQYNIAYRCMANRWSVRMLEQAIIELKAGKKGKPIKDTNLQQFEVEAKELAKRFMDCFACKSDAVVRKGLKGYIKLQFENQGELEKLTRQMAELEV